MIPYKSFQLLFFLLIPIGVIIMFKAIRILKKSFAGDVVAEFPFSQKGADFEIIRPGVYTIWQKGQYLRKMPLDKFRPVIHDKSTKDTIPLTAPLFRPNIVKTGTVQMEIFRFKAETGRYHIELAPGSSISALESFFTSLVPAKDASLEKYFIIVKESQPFLTLLSGIMLLVVSALMITGGLVMGILSM